MPFEPFTWLLSFAFSTSANKLMKAVFDQSSLSKKLLTTINQWTAELPSDLRIHPHSLTPRTTPTEQHDEPDKWPAATALAKCFSDGIVPTQEQWISALIEQWQTVKAREGKNAARFYQLTVEEATPHLQDLASRLHKVCMQDENLFRTTVLLQLEKQGLIIEMLRRGHEIHKEAAKKKSWRELESLNLPSWNDHERILSTYGILLITQLHKHFESRHHCSFNALLKFEISDVQIPEGIQQMPNINIISGHVGYLGAVRSALIRQLNQANPQRAREEGLAMNNDFINMRDDGWTLHAELPTKPGVYIATFNYDLETQNASIRNVPLKSSLKLDVPTNATTSDALIWAAQVLNYNNGTIIFNFKDQSIQEPIVKFAFDVIASRTVSLSNFRINREDPEDWDYICKPYDTLVQQLQTQVSF